MGFNSGFKGLNDICVYKYSMSIFSVVQKHKLYKQKAKSSPFEIWEIRVLSALRKGKFALCAILCRKQYNICLDSEVIITQGLMIEII